MSIVTWTPPSYGDAEDSSAVATALVYPSPRCVFCGDDMERGQRAWVWHGMADQHITAHAECLARHASGILGDIATAVRK